MPLRTLKSKKYTGVYELYSAKTGDTTGYYIQFRDEFGKPQKFRSNKSTNADEALLHLNQCKHDVIRAKKECAYNVSAKKQRRIKLNDLATEFFSTKGETVDKRVRARYNNHVQSEPIGALIVDKITLQDVEILKTTLATKKFSKNNKEYIGLAKGTQNHILAMVKTIIKYGIQNRYCTYNIFDSIVTKRTSRQRLKVLTPEEVYELIDNASYNKRLQMFVRMLYFTAQRPKTILEMQRKHINLDDNSIYIPKIKNQRETTLPISNSLKPYLIELIKDLNTDDFLFHQMQSPKNVNQKADPTKKVSFQQIQKSAIKLFKPYNEGLTSSDDNLMRVSFYTLRHSAATNILKVTKNIYLVQKILNHSDIKMTQRYAKLIDTEKKEGLDVL